MKKEKFTDTREADLDKELKYATFDKHYDLARKAGMTAVDASMVAGEILDHLYDEKA